MTACENSGYSVSDHFAQVSEMVEIGSGAFREMESFTLSRYACYLIIMFAEEAKEIVAIGKTYFLGHSSKDITNSVYAHADYDPLYETICLLDYKLSKKSGKD